MDPENDMYCYRYPHAAVTADCVIFGFDGRQLKVLLIERGNEPYLGHWALPGGFMHIDETIEQTAERELREETNLSGVYMEQFKTYSDVDRDPRERVITVVFIALVRPEAYRVIAGDDAARCFWFDEKMLPPLAFDHRRIVREAREHLKETLRIKPIAFQLLNPTFSIGELQKVYEVINDTEYDRRNFQRSVLESNILQERQADEDSAPSRRTQKVYSLDDAGFEGESAHDSVAPAPMAMEETCVDFSESICCEASPAPPRSMPRKKKEGSTKGLFDFLRRK